MLYVPSTVFSCQGSHFWNPFKKYMLTPMKLFNYFVCVCVLGKPEVQASLADYAYS